MKNNKKIYKRVAIVLALILLSIGAFTLGYFFKNDGISDKQVGKTVTVDGEIGGTVKTEDSTKDLFPGDKIDKNIEIKPNCTAPSLLRVKIEPYWDGKFKGDKKDNSYLTINYNEEHTPVENLKTGNSEAYWYQSSDGYLYYMGQVDENIKLMNIVDNITFESKTNDNENINKYQGANLKINIDLDIVQCKDGAFESAWQVKDENLKVALSSICSNK